MQHCTTQCPSGTLEPRKHLLNPTHSGPNWIAQLISQSLWESAHDLCLSESPAHVQSTVLAFLSFFFFLRWSKSTVWKRRVTGVFCLPNVISSSSLLPNSTQLWKIHKLPAFGGKENNTNLQSKKKTLKEEQKTLRNCNKDLRSRPVQKMEISCQNQRNCTIAKEPDNPGNQDCCLEAKYSVI